MGLRANCQNCFGQGMSMTAASKVWQKFKQSITALLGNNVATGIAGTMLLKAASAIIAFSLFSLAANAAGAEEFGKFSIFFSIASMLAVVAAGGQELQVVRSWNQYISHRQPAMALGALRYGWIVSSLGVAIIGTCFGLFLLADLDITPLQIHGNVWLAVAALAFLATNCLSMYSSHAARTIVGIRMGDAQYELTWRTLVIIFLVICLALGRDVTTDELLGISAFGLMIVVAIQSYAINRKVAIEVGKLEPQYDRAEWTPRSIRLWLASIMESSNQHLEVFLIGLLLDPMAAGAYFVASRLANAFALAADGINTFGTRRVPGLYFAGQTEDLKHTLHLMACMSLIIFLGGLGTVLVAGEYLLMIFGREYMDYYHVLLILSIGTGLTAANGPAPVFMQLTGFESRYMKIVSASVAYRVLGFLIVIPYFGLVGAAVITASVMVAMAVLNNFLCRKLTGMDPSILRLIWESDDTLPADSPLHASKPAAAE